MTTEEFWDLIERSREDVFDCDEQAEQLTDLLAELEPEEIVAFDELWTQKHTEAYRWDLWAVAYIVNGGCSDDAFTDFRYWLVAQGQKYFEAALAEPERAGDRATPGEDDAECEQIGYAPGVAYERKTGRELPRYGAKPDTSGEPSTPIEPAGETWSEEDLPTLYPELCERFGW